MIPDTIKNFIEAFSKLPSVGPRMATRLAFYLVSLGREKLKTLESALSGLKNLDRCPRCFFMKGADEKFCSICNDPRRNKSVIAIAEKETDLLSIEKTGRFHGHYLLLGELGDRGVLESGQKLRLQHLKDRIRKELGGKAREIVVAVNPNAFGDFIEITIRQEFKELAEKITRLGRGIPTGGEIEFADEETLGSAIEHRL